MHVQSLLMLQEVGQQTTAIQEDVQAEEDWLEGEGDH